MHCSVYTYEALGSRRYIQRCHCCTFPKLSSTHRGPLPSKSILLWDIRISSEVCTVYIQICTVYIQVCTVYIQVCTVYIQVCTVCVHTYVSSVVCTVYIRNRVVCTVYAVVCDYHYWYP